MAPPTFLGYTKANMIRIESSYAGSYGKTFEEFIDSIDDLHISGVQLIPDQSPNLFSELNIGRISKIREALNRRKLQCSVHNIFYDINIVSLVPEVQRFALELTHRIAIISSQLGASSLTVHPGYMFPGWRVDAAQTKRFWEAAHRGMTELSNIAHETGVPILLENGSYHVTTSTGRNPRPLHAGISPVELESLFGSTDLMWCFDFNKAISTEHNIEDFLATSGERIRLVQVSNIEAHPEDWKKFVSYIKAHALDVSIVLEGPRSQRPKDISVILRMV